MTIDLAEVREDNITVHRRTYHGGPFDSCEVCDEFATDERPVVQFSRGFEHAMALCQDCLAHGLSRAQRANTEAKP